MKSCTVRRLSSWAHVVDGCNEVCRIQWRTFVEHQFVDTIEWDIV